MSQQRELFPVPRKKEVYLIDGSAYIYRAYHAIRPLTNSNGLPTHAVYGFTTILRRLLREKEPEHLAVAFDTRGPVFRHTISAEYKANRPPMPEDLVPQIPYIHKIVDAYNLLSMSADNLEADDLIASAAQLLVEQGCKVVIVSGDKDLLQLVSEDITMWDPMHDRLMDAAAVEEKYGLGPKQLLDYFALVGDSSDNISGVPGVGPKTAQKLLAEYTTLEGLYEQIDGLKKSKMKERLIAHKKDAFLSRDLVRLEEKAEVAADLQAYQVVEADPDTLRDLLTELEFFTLLKSEVPAAKVATEGFVLVRQREELEQLVELLGKQLQGAGQLVLDTETTSLDPLQAELVGVSLCTETKQAWYLACGHRDSEGELLPDQLTVQDIVDLLGPLLTDPDLAKIGHNLKYDYAILAALQNGGIRLAGPLYDTMLGAWLLEPGRRSYKLDDLCQEIDLKLTPFSEVVDGDKSSDAFCRVAPDIAKNYSCEDVFGSLRLFEEQRPELEKQELWTLFSEVEGALIPVLAAMEETGILLDKEVLQGLTKEFGARMDELEQEIYALAGHAFNINSSQQLAEVLFDELGLPKGRKTKTGYSTDVKVLEKLSHKHELPARILRFRNLAKLKSTYVDKLQTHISPVTGRVHSSFNQWGTATGRLSSSNPNLQNIPIRTEEGRRIRSAFIAPPGSLLLSADYSQIDLRVLAHYSQDQALLEAFRGQGDIHSQTAAEIFQVAPQLLTGEMRRVAKSINFGIVYGMSAFGLSAQLGISRKDAQTFIDRYFVHYPGIQQFMDDIMDQARADGYVTTLLGRRRQLPEINVSNRNRRQFAERMAINTPIQGTASDIIKLAMIKVHEELLTQKAQAKLLLQIHDELVLEVPEDEQESVAAMVKATMESVMKLDVPLKVNTEVGPSLDKGE
ncbi:DNA polymerase I [Candidatus Electrothrix sp.]|uniref:DNA polymerase I n=1 Tax=Candidatus Electrothrix sp. TaxID=2170559 RepID=UPI0040573F65